jgi:NADH:ubiquinone oxidoreductase subunit 5 (subunit L)/multisubunit Na+/H+ antiporter MnhA subunit
VYLRTLLIVFLVAVVAIFAVLNWSAFMSETTLSVGFTTVQAPLGLVLLIVTALLALLFLIYVVYLQSSVLLENRRQSRELQNQREIAENAEASRFYQLKTSLEEALREQSNQAAQFNNAILARLEKLDRDLRVTVEQSSNSLAAYIGEVEDRFEHAADEKK